MGKVDHRSAKHSLKSPSSKVGGGLQSRKHVPYKTVTSKDREVAKKEVQEKKKQRRARRRAVGPVSKLDQSNGTINWKGLFMLGGKLDSIESIVNGTKNEIEWEFSTLQTIIEEIKSKNPDKDLFLFSSSEMKDSIIQGSNDLVPTPVLQIVLVRRGYKPPEFVSIKRFQHGTEDIVPFGEMKLEWQPYPGVDHVYVLKSKKRCCVVNKMDKMKQYDDEYALLFTVKPSKDWKINKNGELDVQHAMFTYTKDDGEVIDEQFDKEAGDTLKEFIPDFIERHELNEENDEIKSEVKEAIKAGFTKVRNEEERKKNLFANYPEEVLDEMTCIKVYPSNDFVTDQHKVPIVNRYYGKAAEVH